MVRGAIFRPLQTLSPSFFACSQCFGTWVGAGAGAAGVITTGRGIVVDAIIVGGATSFLSLLADAMLLQLLGDPNEGKSP